MKVNLYKGIVIFTCAWFVVRCAMITGEIVGNSWICEHGLTVLLFAGAVWLFGVVMLAIKDWGIDD